MLSAACRAAAGSHVAVTNIHHENLVHPLFHGQLTTVQAAQVSVKLATTPAGQMDPTEQHKSVGRRSVTIVFAAGEIAATVSATASVVVTGPTRYRLSGHRAQEVRTGQDS